MTWYNDGSFTVYNGNEFICFGIDDACIEHYHEVCWGIFMGILLNPKNMAFEEAVKSEIYIDKSNLIQFTNSKLRTKQKHICVSRPRRFGKSMAADMLAAYYSRGCTSRELFQGLQIAESKDFEKHLNKYNVIYVNMLDKLTENGSIEAMIDAFKKQLLWELEEEFGQVRCYDPANLVIVLETIFQKEGCPFVFVIDEWDCVFRKKKSDSELTQYLDFLRNLLKDKSYLALAYMTGILPIKKYGEHSALNMFDEYSMINAKPIEEFTGFTEDEVKELCERYHMNFAEMRKWYDGYCLGKFSIYNPKSVVEAVARRKFDNYWTSTENYEALKIYIQMNYDGLKDKIIQMIAGEAVVCNTRKFQNDMTTFQNADDVLTLLIHLGYLTYDFDAKTTWIPNSEVADEFINSIEDGGWEPVTKAIRLSEELLQATLDLDAPKVAELIAQSHMENSSILKYNDENALACVLSLAYYAARTKYIIHRELAIGKGFADIVFIPRKNVGLPVLVIELKYNKPADTAIMQIKNKNYTNKISEYSGEILLVGISYDDKKNHSCVIEKVVK